MKNNTRVYFVGLFDRQMKWVPTTIPYNYNTANYYLFITSSLDGQARVLGRWDTCLVDHSIAGAPKAKQPLHDQKSKLQL
jgi:hypothetical protein